VAQTIAYRVPRRFIVPPEEPPPYGLLALSFVAHVAFFSAVLVLSSLLATRLDQSKIYVVNLVPTAPTSGTPTPTPVQPRVAERTPPAPEVKSPPTPPKVEERTPPKPTRAEAAPPRETPPPRPEKAEPLAPPKLPDIARAAPVRPQELALPRRVEKESPALDVPGARERLVDPAPPPPPPPSAAPRLPPEPPRPTAPRLPEPPRVVAPQPAPAAPMVATARPAVESPRPGALTMGVASKGNISLDVSDFPFTYYLRQIQAKISERWAPPRPAARGGERAIILFEIGRDGSIKEPTLEKSSGLAPYDQSALRAVAEASPFPPLPPEFKAPSLRIHFGFEFQPDQG
jgi:TonB family protein